MRDLNDNWFLKPIFDFEYKSYQIMGYTQYLNFQFENQRFYPFIERLKSKLEEVSLYRQAKSEVESKLLRDIDRLDFENKQIIRRPIEDKTGILNEIECTLDFAEAKMSKCYDLACAAFERVERQIQITPLGITESNPTNGLLLFKKPGQVRIYSYSLRMVIRPDGKDKYKDLKTNYLKDITVGVLPDLHRIKWNIIKKASMTVGTNAYVIDSDPQIPHFETVLPVVKYYLIRNAQ